MHKLEKWRKSKKMTRQELADRLGVCYDTVRRYEVKYRVPEEPIVIDIYVLTDGKVKPQHFYRLPTLGG